MKVVHSVKTKSEYYDAAERGAKSFTIRIADRPYKVGDILRKIRLDDAGRCTDKQCDYLITYRLDGGQYGIEQGYCVLGILRIGTAKDELKNIKTL